MLIGSIEQITNKARRRLADFASPVDQQRSHNSLAFGRLAITLGFIFSIALGVRLLYWQDSSTAIAREDSTIQALGVPYRHEAQRILERGGILIPQESVDRGDARLIIHPPGYSIIMAALIASRDEPDEVLRFVQIICAASEAVLVTVIALDLLPFAASVLAGLLVALSPHQAYYSIFLSPDSLAVLPIVISIYLITRASKHPRMITVVGAGFLIGVSCWLRANALLLSPFLALVLPVLFERGKRLRYSLALVTTTLMVISPITVRNWVVYDRVIPISVGAGLNLIEGIAEYDKESRFGLPVLDPDVVAKEVEWSGRSDYGQGLYFPDGIERDHDRVRRGLAVIKSNPAWFLGVMLRRALFMLRHNDFSLENPAFNSPVAPAVSHVPTYGHGLAVPADIAPVYSSPLVEMLAGSSDAPGASVSSTEEGGVLRVMGDASDSGEQFISAPIAVQKGTDYILRLQVVRAQDAMSVKVRGADPRIVLARSRIPATREKKAKKREVTAERSEDENLDARRYVYLQFATEDLTEIHVAIANDKVTANQKEMFPNPVVLLGKLDLFDVGATPHQWTRYPRAPIRAIQKNTYKTEWMLLLIAAGVILLLLAHRRRALLILVAVPGYYLIFQSALHTEYRYILAIQCFLLIFPAAALYCASLAVWRGIRRLGFSWAER